MAVYDKSMHVLPVPMGRAHTQCNVDANEADREEEAQVPLSPSTTIFNSFITPAPVWV